MSNPEIRPVYHEGVDNLLQNTYQIERATSRGNLGSLAELIEQDPALFARLVEDFDQVVSLYNRLRGIASMVVPGMLNFQDVKPRMPHLPLLRDTLLSEPLVLQETLGNLSTLMHRKDEGLGAPDTEWHRWESEDTEAHMVYSLFRLYAEILWREHPEAEATREGALGPNLDQVLDALIEVMPLVLENNNPVYNAVANTERLNWLAEGGPFDSTWLQLLEQKAILSS